MSLLRRIEQGQGGAQQGGSAPAPKQPGEGQLGLAEGTIHAFLRYRLGECKRSSYITSSWFLF